MQWLLLIVSYLLILSVLISLVRNDYWIFKVLEYPRLQKLVLILIATSCWAFYWPLEVVYHKVTVALLLLCIFYLLYKIWPYTVLFKKELLRVTSTDPGNEIRIYAANVLQDNKAYHRLLEQVHNTNPDVIFLLEADKGWENGLRELDEKYPYTLKAPLDNTYGLLFYSRFPLKEGKVAYLVKHDIPSIETFIELPSGRLVKIWGLHPEPPVPDENLYATAKDKELMKVALTVRKCNTPVFVFGDLNDVAWSHTTELFRKTSRLLDPRRGRGFYSTFSAHHWFVRFPLDYIFCSEHFGLVSMQRMPPNGSDHFATLTHLALSNKMIDKQEAPEADEQELEEAKEKATQ